MNLRAQRRFLWGVNFALATGILVSACALLATPLDVAVEGAEGGPAAGGGGIGSQQAARETAPLGQYAVIYERDLRKPLFDPKPVKVAKPKPAPPKLKAVLVGTAVEPGFTYGLFRTPAGEVKLVRVGETIEGATVVAVAGSSATVTLQGHTLTLTVEKRD